MKRLAPIATGIFLFGMLLSTQVGAEETSPVDTYSGDIWTRSTLTGDWWGVRNDLAAKGIILDMGLTQIGQGVVGGGKDKGWKYGGRGDLTINVDNEKLGLWPGNVMLHFNRKSSAGVICNPRRFVIVRQKARCYSHFEGFQYLLSILCFAYFKKATICFSYIYPGYLNPRCYR